MIGSLGVPELLFILVLALLVFGPRKLPEIGKTLGRAMGEFRRATSDLKRTLDVELSTEQLKTPPSSTVTPRVSPGESAPTAAVPSSPETPEVADEVVATPAEVESEAPEKKDSATDPS